MTGDGLERIRGLAEKGVRTEQSRPGHEFAWSDDAGALEMAVERPSWDVGGVGQVGHTSKGRRISYESVGRHCHTFGQMAQWVLQSFEQLGRKLDARLPLEQTPQVLQVVVETIEHDLFDSVLTELDQRAERLSGQHRIHDHGE